MPTDPPPSTWLPDNARPSHGPNPKANYGSKSSMPGCAILSVVALIVVTLGGVITYRMVSHDDTGAAAPAVAPFTFTPSYPYSGFTPPPPAGSAPLTTAPPPSLSDYERTYRMVVAKKRCEEAVRDQRKAPTTADFSDTDAVPDNGSPTFAVTGQVDAQNGFGAHVRSSWTCTARSDAADRDLFYLSDVSVALR